MNIIPKENTSLSTPSTVWSVNKEDMGDLKFPRAKIFQGTPTEFEKYPDAKPGTIINHLTGEILSDTFIPFMKFKQYAKFNARNSKDPGFDPNAEPGAMLWVTTDSTDPRVEETKWGEHGEKPTAVEFMNFMCMFDGQPFPVILPFAKTSLAAGKKLFSMLVFAGGNGLNRKYKLSAKKKQSDGNTYYVYDVNPAGMATKEEEEAATNMRNQFAAKASAVSAEFEE